MKLSEILLVETFHKQGSLARIVDTSFASAPSFSAIKLADVAAPACLAIEPRTLAAHALAKRAGALGGDRAGINRAFIIAYQMYRVLIYCSRYPIRSDS